MLNTYVGLLGAAVAIQGVMAQDNALVPNRDGPLDPGHVAKSHPLANSACYQNSKGQFRDDGSTLKYPCISQLEIDAYCKMPAFEKNLDAQKECFFGPGSTFSQDYAACVECKALNGQVTEKWLNDQRAFIGDLKTKFVDENTKDNFQTVYERNKPADPAGPPIPPKVKVVNGVASINILDYYKNPPKSQQAGAPIPEEKKTAETKTATSPKTATETKSATSNRTATEVAPAAGTQKADGGAGGQASGTVQVNFENCYPAVVSLRQGNDQVASGKQNTSSDVATTGDVKGFVWVKMWASITVSINAAQAGVQANSGLNFQEVVKTTGFSISKNQPLPETAVTVDAKSSVWDLVQNNVFSSADSCGCFESWPLENFQLASPAAKGNGVPTTERISGSKTTGAVDAQGSANRGSANQGSVKCKNGAKGGAKGGNPASTESTPAVSGSPVSGSGAPVNGRPESSNSAPANGRPGPGSSAPVNSRPESGSGAPVINNRISDVTSPASQDDVTAKIEAGAKIGLTADESKSLPWCE